MRPTPSSAALVVVTVFVYDIVIGRVVVVDGDRRIVRGAADRESVPADEQVPFGNPLGSGHSL